MKQHNTGPGFSYPNFAEQLVQWFDRAQRDLPWRWPENARDPYRVLVSEVMLQQTTVAAVVPFYQRFIARFPDVQSLAAASLEDVLPLWAGLGYYQRARLLHRCAQTVVEQHGGVFPRDLEQVLALPGIGRYTAGAVTSIAYDAPSPIVDANVARVFSRVFLIEGDLKARQPQAQLWDKAEALMEACAASTQDELLRPSIVNPALMELGALICTPRAPRCPLCPVAEFCGAHATGRENELPHAVAKPQTIELRDVCVFISRRDASARDDASTQQEQVLLRQRPHEAKVWWRGMWELPRLTAHENESSERESSEDAVRRLLCDELELAAESFSVDSCLRTVQHGVTHHRITLECWGVSLLENAQPRNARWFPWDETADLALPSSMRRLLAWLRKHPATQGKTAQQPSLW
ncbi:MAG TPA: A/G-specific adenine glycosylase [Abditibacteriaceae bacterium]